MVDGSKGLVRWVCGIPLFLSACELTEVTVPRGEPRIVVQSVFSRTATQQFVVVERSIIGEGPDRFGGDQIPPEGPARPIENAVVMLEYRLGTVCGLRTDTLVPQDSAPGLYLTGSPCQPTPGDVVGLRVVTPQGEVVTGTTIIPGAGLVAVELAGVRYLPQAFVQLNQDRDTARLAARPLIARGMQVEVRPPVGDPVFFLLTDSLVLSLPGNLVNPFENDEGEMVFRAGFEYALVTALTDTNYYDFARSFTDPFTGRGFINRLQGGIGVFGSVETHGFLLHVVGDVDDPREGSYRIEGTLQGRPVAVTWELYLDQRPANRFGAFVDGDWYGGRVRTSADGEFGPFGAEAAEFSAWFTAGPDSARVQWQLLGRRGPQGVSFPVQVVGFGISDIRGTLSATQISGPLLR